MAEKKWTEVNGMSNLDEVDEKIFARLNEGTGNTEVTYLAYGGLRIVELEGNIEFGDVSENQKALKDFKGHFNDFEVALPVKTKGGVVVIGINDMDEVLADGNVTRVLSSVNVEGDELDDYEDESGVMELFCMDC